MSRVALELNLAWRLGLLGLGCCSAGAQAQGLNEDSGAAERQLETVTVRARRSLEDRFFATGSQVIVDRRDIEELGAYSVGDVLRQLPGLMVTPSADGGVEIRMRGMDRNATQLMIDGQRVSSGRSQLPLDQLPAELIERIEIVRAPSAEFSGASGGTVNIVLREASPRRETNIRLTDNHVWGRDATQGFFARTGPLGASAPAAPTRPTRPPAKQKSKDETAEPSAENADAADESSQALTQAATAAAARLESLPWNYFMAVARTGILLGSDVHRETQVAGATSAQTDTASRYRRGDWTLLPRLNGRLSSTDQLALRATISTSRNAGEVDGSGFGTSTGRYALTSHEDQERVRDFVQAGADWTHRFKGAKMESSLIANRAVENIDRTGRITQDFNPPATTTGYTFSDDRRDQRLTLKSKVTGTGSGLLWSMGFEVEDQSLRVDTRSSSGTANLQLTAELKRRVLWAQNEWELPARTTLTAGLRGEALVSESTDASLLARHTQQWLQPSVHLRTPVSEDLQLRANLSRITRNPSLLDLIDRTVPSQGSNSISSPDTLGNPNLRPEVTMTLDMGFEQRLKDQGQVGLNLFTRQSRDVLANVTSFAGGRWVEQRSNAGDAQIWGLEADVKTGLGWAGLGRDWTLSGNASLLQSRMVNGPNEGNRIPGQPRYLANINVAKPLRRTGGWFGGASLALNGPAQLNTSPGITGLERSRATLDLYVGRVHPGWGYWRIGVYNLGDAPYQRERHYTDGLGNAVDEKSSMTLTPRVYASIGTQF